MTRTMNNEIEWNEPEIVAVPFPPPTLRYQTKKQTFKIAEQSELVRAHIHTFSYSQTLLPCSNIQLTCGDYLYSPLK